MAKINNLTTALNQQPQALEHVSLGRPTGEAMFYDPQAPSAAHLLCQVSIPPEWFVADGIRIEQEECK